MSRIHSIADVRRAAELVKMLDQARLWREAFDAEKRPLIAFENICGRDAEGAGLGWDDDLVLPRETAIEMMQWLARRAEDELMNMGVTT